MSVTVCVLVMAASVFLCVCVCVCVCAGDKGDNRRDGWAVFCQDGGERDNQQREIERECVCERGREGEVKLASPHSLKW